MVHAMWFEFGVGCQYNSAGVRPSTADFTPVRYSSRPFRATSLWSMQITFYFQRYGQKLKATRRDVVRQLEKRSDFIRFTVVMRCRVFRGDSIADSTQSKAVHGSGVTRSGRVGLGRNESFCPSLQAGVFRRPKCRRGRSPYAPTALSSKRPLMRVHAQQREASPRQEKEQECLPREERDLSFHRRGPDHRRRTRPPGQA